MKFQVIALALVGVVGTEATSYPVGVSNCGVQSWIEDAPKRAVTMNQGTTEVMLGLGLADHMVGTAYLDDEIWPEVAKDYEKIPVLSETYPDIDTLKSVDPDFIYASYRSAFEAKTSEDSKRIDYFDIVEECELMVSTSRGNYTYCRPELHEKGIQTYLQTPSCELEEHRPDEGTLNTLYQEIWDIALIFNAFEKARVLVDNIESHFKAAARIVEFSEAEKPKVLWLDGWHPVTPFVGACCGSVQAIIDYAGGVNIYESLGLEAKATWADGSWDNIVEADPDVIVMIDASWDIADQKIYELCKNETTRELRAVKNRNFITVPFSASTLGVRIGTLAYNLAEAFVAFSTGNPLSSVDFSEVTVTMDGDEGGQAVGSSGARVYTRLPIWNGTDLETFCPGGPESNAMITDDAPFVDFFSDSITVTNTDAEIKEVKKIPAWGTALIVIFAVGGVAAIGFIVHMVKKEKEGTPLFAIDDKSMA